MRYFVITDYQEEQLKKWINEHECSVRGKYHGAIGGSLSYVFVPTSIDLLFNIECACGKKECILDEGWDTLSKKIKAAKEKNEKEDGTT